MLVDIIKLSRDLKVNGFTREARQVLGLRKLAEDENSMIMAEIVDQRLSVEGDPYKFSSRGEESGSIVFRILDTTPGKSNLVGKDIVSGVKGYDALMKRLINSTASPNSMLTDANIIAKTISDYIGNDSSVDKKDIVDFFNTVTNREDESFKKQILTSLRGIDRSLYTIINKELFHMTNEEREEAEKALGESFLFSRPDEISQITESYGEVMEQAKKGEGELGQKSLDISNYAGQASDIEFIRSFIIRNPNSHKARRAGWYLSRYEELGGKKNNAMSEQEKEFVMTMQDEALKSAMSFAGINKDTYYSTMRDFRPQGSDSAVIKVGGKRYRAIIDSNGQFRCYEINSKGKMSNEDFSGSTKPVNFEDLGVHFKVPLSWALSAEFEHALYDQLSAQERKGHVSPTESKLNILGIKHYLSGSIFLPSKSEMHSGTALLMKLEKICNSSKKEEVSMAKDINIFKDPISMGAFQRTIEAADLTFDLLSSNGNNILASKDNLSGLSLKTIDSRTGDVVGIRELRFLDLKGIIDSMDRRFALRDAASKSSTDVSHMKI